MNKQKDSLEKRIDSIRRHSRRFILPILTATVGILPSVYETAHARDGNIAAQEECIKMYDLDSFSRCLNDKRIHISGQTPFGDYWDVDYKARANLFDLVRNGMPIYSNVPDASLIKELFRKRYSLTFKQSGDEVNIYAGNLNFLYTKENGAEIFINEKDRVQRKIKTPKTIPVTTSPSSKQIILNDTTKNYDRIRHLGSLPKQPTISIFPVNSNQSIYLTSQKQDKKPQDYSVNKTNTEETQKPITPKPKQNPIINPTKKSISKIDGTKLVSKAKSKPDSLLSERLSINLDSLLTEKNDLPLQKQIRLVSLVLKPSEPVRSVPLDYSEVDVDSLVTDSFMADVDSLVAQSIWSQDSVSIDTTGINEAIANRFVENNQFRLDSLVTQNISSPDSAVADTARVDAKLAEVLAEFNQPYQDSLVTQNISSPDSAVADTARVDAKLAEVLAEFNQPYQDSLVTQNISSPDSAVADTARVDAKLAEVLAEFNQPYQDSLVTQNVQGQNSVSMDTLKINEILANGFEENNKLPYLVGGALLGVSIAMFLNSSRRRKRGSRLTD